MLGLLLFILYSNDVVIMTNQATFIAYSDDISLFFPGAGLGNMITEVSNVWPSLKQLMKFSLLTIIANKIK